MQTAVRSRAENEQKIIPRGWFRSELSPPIAWCPKLNFAKLNQRRLRRKHLHRNRDGFTRRNYFSRRKRFHSHSGGALQGLGKLFLLLP